MEEKQLEELKDNVKKLKEMSRSLSEKIHSKISLNPADEGLPVPAGGGFERFKPNPVFDDDFIKKEEEYKNKIAEYEQRIPVMEAKLKNSTNEKNSLQEQFAELLKENEKLFEKIRVMETGIKNMESHSSELSDKLSNYDHANWVKFSLDLIYQFMIEIDRYFRNTRGISKEALDICTSMAKKNTGLKNKLKLVEEEMDKVVKVLYSARESYKVKDPVFKRVNLHPVVDKVIAGVLSKMKSDTKINTKFFSKDVFVEIDEGMLEEILNNVITNSMEAILNKGYINIEIKDLNDRVQVEITDNGHSVAPHLIDKVFCPFLTTKQGHTGLGLTRAYWLAQLINARIEFRGDVNKGTTVKIILPYNK